MELSHSCETFTPSKIWGKIVELSVLRCTLLHVRCCLLAWKQWWQLSWQEAQLLQTDCTMHIIEYFVKSLKVVQTYWKLYHSKAWVVSYSQSIVTMALTCKFRLWDKVRYWSKIAIFFIPPAFDAPLDVGFPSEYCHTIWCEKLAWHGYPMLTKSDDMFSRFDTILTCLRHTDKQTNILQQQLNIVQ